MSCKVLLLDEDEVSSRALESGLRELGCEVLLIPDMFGVSRALARIAKEPFDLIVLSADSRSVGGLGIYDRIKRDPKSGAIPIIVIGSDTDAGGGSRVAPDARIARPIEQNDILAAMQKCFPSRIQSGVHSRTRIATLPPDALDDDDDDDDAVAVEWSEDAPATGDGQTVDALNVLLAREKAAHHANVARARQALFTARAAKHAATRKAEGRAARVSKNQHELAELRQQVTQATKEHRAAMDALSRDNERTVERLTRRAEGEGAALAAERAARATLEATHAAALAARTEAPAAPASVKPDANVSALEDLRTAHAAELARLREEIAASVLESERASAARVEDERTLATAKLTAIVAESEARRSELEGRLDEARTRGGSVEATSSEEIAGLRVAALEEELRASNAARAELAALHERTARDLANHRKEQEAAVGRAALAPLLQLRRTEEMYAAAKVAQAAAESFRAADQAEIANARAVALASDETLAALKVAQAAELSALDESLLRMLEQERITGAAKLEEAREAAVRIALEEAVTQADARVLAEEEKRVVALAELEAKHDAAIARANEETDEKVGELRALEIAHAEALQADRATAADARASVEADWNARKIRDQEHFARELEAERAARAALAEELLAAKRAHEEALDTARADAAFVLGSTEATLEARGTELTAQRDREAARGTALDAELAAAKIAHEEGIETQRANAASVLASTAAQLSARNAEVVADRDIARARGTALDNELAAAHEAHADLSRERDRLLHQVEAERVEHARLADSAMAAAREQERAALEKLAELNARHLEVVAERQEQTARAEAREEALAAANIAHEAATLAERAQAGADLAREKERLLGEIDAERGAHASLLESTIAAARDREDAAEEKLKDANARHLELVTERHEKSARVEVLAAELAAAKVEHVALTETLQTERADAVSMVASTESRLSARNTELRAELDAAAARGAALESDLEVVRGAGADFFHENERLMSEIDAERAEHASLVERMKVTARDRETALEEKHAEVAREAHAKAAEAATREAELAAANGALEKDLRGAHEAAETLSHELEAARAQHASVLEASRAAAGTVASERERLALEMDAERAEHARSIESMTGAARDREVALEEKVVELNARHLEVVSERHEKATRVSALEAELAAAELAHGKALEVERTNAAAAEAALNARNASVIESLGTAAKDREQTLQEQLAEERARHVEVARDRDETASRATTLDAELVAAKLAHESALGERTNLLRDLETERREHAAAQDRAGVHATQLARAHEETIQAERARAAAALTSTEAALNSRNEELVRDRDQAATRSATLETDLEAAKAAAAASTRERERLEVEIAAARAAHTTETEQRVAAARDRERETEQKLAGAEAREASKLAALSAELEAKRRLDLAAERDQQGARRREIEAEHAAALGAREAAHAQALAARDVALSGALEEHEAALAHALSMHDAAREGELAKRDAAHVAAIAVHDSAYADSRASIGAEHAEALAQRETAHADALTRLEATHTATTGDLQRALAEQTALAQAVDAKGSLALAAHDTLVKSLRKELGAAMGALAAERQRRSMEDVHTKALERKRSSGNHRAVTPPDTEEERPTHPPPNILRASGGRPVAHADPRGVLRTILTRSLGTEARAEQVLNAVLGTNGKELTIHGDELLAVLERSLHAELRGQIGEAGAHAAMDEIASVLVARVGAASVRGEDIGHHLTTKPPPPLETVAPVTKDMVKPELLPAPPVVRPPGRRSVLVIDRDRMARANVSRALVREGCDVTVRDSCVGLDEACADYDMIVTEILDVAIDDLIGVFKKNGAPCPVVAWTAAVDAAKTMFNAAAIGHVAVLSKEGRADALVAVIRSSIGGATGAARS